MKLTFVLPNLGLYGGIKSTIAMAQAMCQRGHEVTIISPIIPGRDGRGWLNIRRTVVQVVRTFQNLLGKPKWIHFGGRLERVPWLSERFLPEADFLILTWWADVLSLAGCGPSHGVPLHFVRSYESWGGPAKKVRQSYLAGLPIVVTSETLKGQLTREVGVMPIATIPNGLDPVFFEKSPSPKLEGEPIRIGVLYRLQDWKRMDDAFAVLARCAAHSDLQPVVFGETPGRVHRSPLSKYRNAEYYRLPHGKKLRDIYRSLDIFLFTSNETEAFGNPPFEALACGTAVVSTTVGAVPEYLSDGINARLCAPGDVECLAQCVIELIDQPEQRQRLADAGAGVVGQLDWSTSAARFEELLAGLENQVS